MVRETSSLAREKTSSQAKLPAMMPLARASFAASETGPPATPAKEGGEGRPARKSPLVGEERQFLVDALLLQGVHPRTCLYRLRIDFEHVRRLAEEEQRRADDSRN